jgi:hypothetical protein
LKKALRGEQSKALNGLLKYCGTSLMVNRNNKSFKPIVFLVGDSDIGTGTWSSYETWLVKKLRDIGHIVLLRWEHNTSANCPKEECGHAILISRSP